MRQKELAFREWRSLHLDRGSWSYTLKSNGRQPSTVLTRAYVSLAAADPAGPTVSSAGSGPCALTAATIFSPPADVGSSAPPATPPAKYLPSRARKVERELEGVPEGAGPDSQQAQPLPSRR